MNSSCLLLVLTGPLQTAIGRTEVSICCPEVCRLGEILTIFLQQYPEAIRVLGLQHVNGQSLQQIPPGLLVLKDNTLLPGKPDTEIRATGRLTLMPMISGG
jgi:hypothetical protein